MIDVTAGSGKKLRNRILLAVAALLLIGATAAAVYFFTQWRTLQNDPAAASRATTDRLKSEVGRIYALPGDEDPTVAKVEDKEKLKDQQFFNKAENGDYILIYTNAKLALLYRENEHKLINVGPITISDQSETKPANTPEGTAPADDQSNQ